MNSLDRDREQLITSLQAASYYDDELGEERYREQSESLDAQIEQLTNTLPVISSEIERVNVLFDLRLDALRNPERLVATDVLIEKRCLLERHAEQLQAIFKRMQQTNETNAQAEASRELAPAPNNLQQTSAVELLREWLSPPHLPERCSSHALCSANKSSGTDNFEVSNDSENFSATITHNDDIEDEDDGIQFEMNQRLVCNCI